MTEPKHIEAATKVLAKCSAHDRWFPHPSETTVLAWADAFAGTYLTATDLITGVDHAYRTVEGEFRPKPADIIRHARTARTEALRALPQARIDDMETANHILQDMGFSPQEAYRFSRQVALRQKPDLKLAPAQLTEFQELFNLHQDAVKNYKDRRRELLGKIRVADLYAIEERAS